MNTFKLSLLAASVVTTLSACNSGTDSHGNPIESNVTLSFNQQSVGTHMDVQQMNRVELLTPRPTYEHVADYLVDLHIYDSYETQTFYDVNVKTDTVSFTTFGYYSVSANSIKEHTNYTEDYTYKGEDIPEAGESFFTLEVSPSKTHITVDWHPAIMSMDVDGNGMYEHEGYDYIYINETGVLSIYTTSGIVTEQLEHNPGNSYNYFLVESDGGLGFELVDWTSHERPIAPPTGEGEDGEGPVSRQAEYSQLYYGNKNGFSTSYYGGNSWNIYMPYGDDFVSLVLRQGVDKNNGTTVEKTVDMYLESEMENNIQISHRGTTTDTTANLWMQTNPSYAHLDTELGEGMFMDSVMNYEASGSMNHQGAVLNVLNNHMATSGLPFLSEQGALTGWIFRNSSEAMQFYPDGTFKLKSCEVEGTWTLDEEAQELGYIRLNLEGVTGYRNTQYNCPTAGTIAKGAFFQTQEGEMDYMQTQTFTPSSSGMVFIIAEDAAGYKIFFDQAGTRLTN